MASTYFTVANGITVFRFFLFIIFTVLLFQDRFDIAVWFFVAAWALDVVDGFAARMLQQASIIGDQLDKWIDRMILGFGTLFLIRTGYLPDAAILLFTKDIGLLPVLSIHAARNEPMRDMGKVGKVMAFVQGVSVFWLLFGLPYEHIVIGGVALAGGMIAVWHLRRVVYNL
jgi:phosphatidylglycerophosphate synthase